MEKGRKKIHLCLACILLAAVAAGVWYYFTKNMEMPGSMGGTLIRGFGEAGHVC